MTTANSTSSSLLDTLQQTLTARGRSCWDRRDLYLILHVSAVAASQLIDTWTHAQLIHLLHAEPTGYALYGFGPPIS